MSDLRLVSALAACCAAGVLTATPYPGYYYPSGMQAGTKVQVVIGGTAVGGVNGAYVTGEGVKVTRLVKVPGFPRATGKTQPGWVVNWLYDLLEGKLTGDKRHREMPPEAHIVETDWAENIWWPYLDERDPLELQIVARDRYTPENYPQATPALDSLIILDIEAEADAKPGRRDIIIVDGGSASAPHSFYITKEPHVREDFFVVPPRNTKLRVPAVLHLPTDIKPQPLPVYLDGQDWPGETDSFYLRLEEGQNLVCAFYGRELLPYLGDAVPGFFNPMLRLYNARGDEVATADDFYYLPDPVLTYKVPEDGFYRLDVHDNLFRGRSDFVYMVHCYNATSDAPQYTPQQRAFACFPPAAAHQPPPPRAGRILKKGTLDCPGRSDRHFIDITEPGEWKFELFARRLGSPVDGVLKLYGPMGSLPLASAPRRAVWDDDPGRLYALKNVGDDEHPIIKTNMLYVGSVPQVECDPVGTWKFLETGRYCVVVSDRVGAGGENYDYTLCMGPLEPTFEVYSSTSAFVGDGGRFKAHILRRGFSGPVTFDSTDEWEVSGCFEQDDEVEVEVSVRGAKGPWKGVKCAQLTASGELPDGRRITVRVTPCDSVEQAFAYTHLLPQAAFYFCARPEEDVVVKNPHPLPHLLGGGKPGDAKKKTKHSNGQSCVSCHDKKKKDHTKGQSCTSCHKNKD